MNIKTLMRMSSYFLSTLPESSMFFNILQNKEAAPILTQPPFIICAPDRTRTYTSRDTRS